MNPKYTFYKQTKDIDEHITPAYNEELDWQEDPLGYFLIRIEPEKKIIKESSGKEKVLETDPKKKK